MRFNLRERWNLSWTTTPGNLGYGTPDAPNWDTIINFRGTLRQCFEEKELLDKLTGNCMKAFRIWRIRGGKREEINISDLREYIYYPEYRDCI